MAGRRNSVGKELAAALSGSHDLVAAAGDLAKGNLSGARSTSSNAGGSETVVEMMERLNLTAKEADPLVFDDEGDDDLHGPDCALMGKVLAPNTLHINTIRVVVRPAWGNPKGLVVNHMGPNLFMAEFGSEEDRSRVAKGGPWKLRNHAILLKNFDVNIEPEVVVFDELPVWARLMKLGYELMNSKRGEPLAAKVGKVEKLDVDENGKAWGSFLRARVIIIPMEPIMRYVTVFSVKRNMIVQYEVMYERLPMHCFTCGLLGHSSVVCPTPAVRDADGKLPYHGDKLCVPERKKGPVLSQEHSQAGKSVKNGTEFGSGSQTSTHVPSEARTTQNSGEVSSPLKKKPRARRASLAKKKDKSGPGAAANAHAISPSKLGQKRK
ncbi:hypothetical protein ACQ4PT_051545 [Festuca glaucescens]